MKKIKSAQALLFTLLMAQSPGALANYYRSSIDGISLNRNDYMNLPNNTQILKTECGEYGINGGNQDQYYETMCKDGVLAAQKMAEIYAKGEGEYLGCFDGYQQGLHKGYLDGNRPSDYRSEAEARYKGGIKDAVDEGKEKAAKDSNFSSEGEIIARFRENVRTSVDQQVIAPSADHGEINVPPFDGFNGYDRNQRGGSFHGPVNELKWVSSNADIETKIRARAVYENNISVSDLCSPGPVLFNAGLHRVSLWDIFSAYGEYNFKDYGYKSTERAWNKFATQSDHANSTYMGSVLGEARAYHNIEPRTEPFDVIGQKDDLTKPIMENIVDELGNVIGTKQKVDANGKPMYEQMDYVVRTEQRVVPGYSKAQLQAKFEKGFRKAYQQYVRNYFGQSFIKEHEKFRQAGENTGRAIGKLVAKDLADQAAYDARYRLDSATAYAAEYKELYKQDWNKNFSLFMNQAVVELVDIDAMELQGKDQDGIYRRGEQIRPILTLRNIGMQDGDFTVSLEGSVLNSNGSKFDTQFAPASLKFTYDTNNFLAKINADATVRGSANVMARVQAPGLSSVLQLKSTENTTIVINEIAEIDRANAEVLATKGSGTVYVDIMNPSTVDAGVVDVEVSLDNGTVAETSTRLNASETKRKLSINLNGMDPLRIIKDSGISGTVATKLTSGAEIHSKRFSVSVNQNEELAKYFHQVINNETDNFGNSDRDSRTEALRRKVIELTERDIERELDWDDENERRNTVLARLVRVYRSSTKITEEAQLIYNDFANELNSIYNRVGDYEGYLSLLNELSTVELEERGKKDRK